MKTIILLFALIALASCKKDECDDKAQAFQKYQQALSNCNGSSACVNEVTRQYNAKSYDCD